MFITSAPTGMPSRTPSGVPVSTVPSAVPSITGSVAHVSIIGLTTSEMALNDVDNTKSEIASTYGLFEQTLGQGTH